MKPLISIIVPVYNSEYFIGNCIESIQAQKLKDFELLLINDGSTDNSGEICEKYRLEDIRIKVFHKKNGGASSARNLGIRMSSGEYIGFVDSDDVINEGMYFKMYESIKINNAEIVACGYKEISDFTKETKDFLTPLNHKDVIIGDEIKRELEKLLVQNKILGYSSLCNKLYKNSHIKKNGLYISENISIAEDLCFNINAVAQANCICSINESLYTYRRVNPKSIMNSSNSLCLHIDARKEILKTLKKNHITNNVYEKCLRYENYRTVADYISEFKKISYSKNTRKDKIIKLYRLIHHPYFIKALNNYNQSLFLRKAKVIIVMIKSYLVLERIFVKPKNYNMKRS
ncbi:glycosyltransferase family 2 protein [Halobacillus sp. K22]|uniref:glycosyltransferase family 2 protein n=1 Tax=Halobacillus sp. K22 TaxID=3457431 RepID=UPI003FCC7F47